MQNSFREDLKKKLLNRTSETKLGHFSVHSVTGDSIMLLITCSRKLSYYYNVKFDFILKVIILSVARTSLTSLTGLHGTFSL